MAETRHTAETVKEQYTTRTIVETCSATTIVETFNLTRLIDDFVTHLNICMPYDFISTSDNLTSKPDDGFFGPLGSAVAAERKVARGY